VSTLQAASGRSHSMAGRRGVGYQNVINEVLLEKAG
jgi:hypothetical protein